MKKFIMSFVLIFVFGITCGFTSCETSTGGRSMSNNVTDFSQNLVNTTPLTTNPLSRSAVAEDYLEAMATVCIYKTNSTNSTTSLTSFGSGVAIYAGGYIATNWHVISYVDKVLTNEDETDDNLYSIKIQLFYEGEMTETDGELVWCDSCYDLAVVKTDYINMPYVQMKDRWIFANDSERLKIAEEVWTLGTPSSTALFGTYSQGTISSSFERISVTSDSNSYRIYEQLIQHSAPISNGSSGGGLFDSDGYLIGLNTLGLTSTSSQNNNDIYFSVPIYPLTVIIANIAQLYGDGDDNTNYSFPKVGIMANDANYTPVFNSTNPEVCYFLGTGLHVSSIIAGGSAETAGLPDEVAIIGISTMTSSGFGSNGYYQIEDRNDFTNAIIKFSTGERIKIYYNTITADNLNDSELHVCEIVLG